MISKLLAPYESYLWAALAAIILVTGIFIVHKIELAGENKVLAADAKAAAAQVIHTEEVEKRAQEINQADSMRLHTALVAPSPVSPIVVRVCPRSPPKFVMPANGGPFAGSDSGRPSVPGTVDDGSPATGVDIAPETERLLKQADAKVAYWKSYYQNCVKVGACK